MVADSNGVGDFDFSPVAELSLLATALEDGHVKLWKVSEQLSKQTQVRKARQEGEGKTHEESLSMC